MTQPSLSVRELALMEQVSFDLPSVWALTPAPFERRAALAQLRSTLYVEQHHQRWRPRALAQQLKARFERHRISEQEALFWVLALTWPGLKDATAEDLTSLEQLEAAPLPTPDELKARLGDAALPLDLCGAFAYALRALWGMPQALAFLLEQRSISELLMPLLVMGAPLEHERQEVAKLAKAYVQELSLEGIVGAASYYTHAAIFPLVTLSADQVLMASALDRACEVKLYDYYKLLAPLIMALDDDEALIGYLWRVSTAFSPTQLGQLIVRLGLERLEVISRLVRSQHHRAQLKHLLPTLEQVSSWRMVELLYDLSEHQALAQWVSEQLARVDAPLVLGLVRLAARRGKRREFACARLRLILAHDEQGSALIRGVLDGEDASLIKLIEREVLAHERLVYPELSEDAWPAWMQALMALEPSADFAQALKPCLEGLPALLMEDQAHVVPDQVILRMLYACMLVHRTRKRSEDKSIKLERAKKKPEREAIAQLELLAQDLDERAASQWVWALFTWWLEGEAHEPQDWLMYMMAYLGDAIVATQLGQTLGKPRRFKGTRHQAYIKTGLNVLSMMRLPTAWMMLSELERKLKRSLKDHASGLIMQLMHEHKINRQTFEELIIPSFGLDARGSRSFDYGPRSFCLTIKNATTFGLTDSEGTTFKRLPPERDSDDAASVARARQEYKIVVQQLKQTFKAQRERLEEAMLNQRTWPARRWRQLLYEHPVMRHLCCGLVWASFEPGQPQALRLFLPTLDGELIDPDYHPLELCDEHEVCLIHPMMIRGDGRGRWIELLTELEVIQPFEQLSRACYVYEADHARYIDYALKAQWRTPRIFQRWQEAGWSASPHHPGPWLTRSFVNQGVIAHVDPRGDQLQRLGSLIPEVHYVPGQAQLTFFRLGLDERAEGIIPAQELDPLLYSELLRFIILLTPKPVT